MTLDAVPLSVAPPRPDKVVITGIEPKGLIGHNKFMVETCGAGQGELSVKIHGRKGTDVCMLRVISNETTISTVKMISFMNVFAQVEFFKMTTIFNFFGCFLYIESAPKPNP